ncbi:hypothetical protein [Xanthocytophaga flava]|uniref:hypothetical protein n=1 Tax=Xanthocytophaga flava TaxID=3048013 RepID=UPI0028D5F48D|nr:hypothetical protein [Xanthocytophaga flavus]MDJ1470491.1 hypothetical protein [Xanthocytophaga flavus]
MSRFLPVCCLCILVCFTQCGIKSAIGDILGTANNVTTQVTSVIDNAIGDLSSESANWREILQKAINDLPKDVQSTIRTEMTDLLNRAIAASGSEIRCDADFFRNRLIQGLQNIKAQLLGNQPPPLEPQLCTVIPLAIDMELDPSRRNKIEFYGYDFDKAKIKVLLENGGALTDISSFMDQPTHYHMTLNLGGNGVNLTGASTRIILQWNDRNISSIGILQKTTPICEVKTSPNISISPISFMPPHIGSGDREFDGNGPDIYCTVKLENQGNRVDAVIYMSAKETEDDWTEARGTQKSTIYQADPGWQITEIIGPVESSYSYRDNDHELDKFAGTGPVQTYTFMGDGKGDDVGSNTNVTVKLNALRVTLKQTGNCVTDVAIKNALKFKLLAPNRLNRIRQINPRLITPTQ